MDRKGLSVRIKVEVRIRTPLGRHRSIADFNALEDATELLVLCVEDPGAVARLQDDHVHDTTMAMDSESERRETLRAPWNFFAVG
jgi:hypothetical protein